MQPAASATPSPSFAGILGRFAAPERNFPPGREADGLADDVATVVSYEYALRAQGRYRPPEAMAVEELRPVPAASSAAVAPAAPEQRKCASVTIRLTAEENERLRERATEAGMTLSAYVRSCAFEVETLRAQVKQTITELRATSVAPGPAPFWSRLSKWRRMHARHQESSG